MKNFFKENISTLFFIITSVFIELFGITYTNCGFYLTKPFYSLLVLSFFVMFTLQFNKNFRVILSSIILFIQVLINTIFIFLFDQNGTVFEYSMLNQRNDGFGTLEQYTVNYKYIVICSIIIVAYILLCVMIKKYKKYNKKYIYPALSIILLFIITIPVYKEYSKNGSYTSKLYSMNFNKYQEIGMTSNIIYQTIVRNKQNVSTDTSNISDFIYKEIIPQSDYYGVSKNNNLILILVESMEWYPLTMYPEYSEELYPNISYLMDNGIIGTNFYQKEKTDISEALSITGSYPSGKYINYDFPNVQTPFSLPNMLKLYDPNIVVNSFHQNYGDFYNRYNVHNTWGFDKLYAINEMKDFGVNDTWNHKKGERNLDSITIDKMKEEMFPTNKRFFTYWITFSMHGYYKERNNLSSYYEILDNHDILVTPKNSNEEYLKTYMATMMDFDKSLGIMINYLKENHLLNKTTIMMFSDHNTYYNKLSYYAKDIKEKYTTELFRIPFIMYDENIPKNEINKFTTTSDIVPTVLDIFGIPGWKNLYFGNSIFTDTESVVYSRNYNFFLSDKLIGYSINNIFDKNNLTKKDIISFENRALNHLKKLEYIDKIYYNDYFKNNKYLLPN